MCISEVIPQEILVMLPKKKEISDSPTCVISELLFTLGNDKTSPSIATEAPHLPIGCGVRFSPYPTIVPTLNREDYTSSEVQSCWLTREEKAKASNERRKIIKSMELGKKPQDSRGLMTETKAGLWLMIAHVDAIRDAVLMEQERQWDEGISDPELIEVACREISRNSALVFRDYAILDEAEAREIYQLCGLLNDKKDSSTVRITGKGKRRSSKLKEMKETSTARRTRKGKRTSSSKLKETPKQDPPGKTIDVQLKVSYIKAMPDRDAITRKGVVSWAA